MAGKMRGIPESVWTNLSRFQKLSPPERNLFIQAMAFLLLTRIGLRVTGFRRWKALIEQSARPCRRLEPDAQFEVAARITRLVRSAELHAPGIPNCLERSLALWWLLQRAGVEAALNIGARKIESRFEAHAWVELRGRVLNESGDVHRHYACFDAPIAAAEENSH